MNCLVTGGAAGLGLATVKMLLEFEDSKVAVIDISQSKPDELSAYSDERILYFLGTDISKDEHVNKALECVQKAFKYLNVVVNCAGINFTSPIVEIDSNSGEPAIVHSIQDFNRVMEINVIGSFNLIRYACPLLIKSNDANKVRLIINVSSVTATDGQKHQCAYAASKGAINSMTLPLARELGEFGIRVCTIAPGICDTPMVQSSVSDAMKQLVIKKAAYPKRPAQPEEFAKLIKSIIQNSYINATVIRFDAGLRL